MARMRPELTEQAGAIVMRPAPVPMRLVERGPAVAVEPEEPLPILTASDVRAALESGRR
jgi:hypothetical protein